MTATDWQPANLDEVTYAEARDNARVGYLPTDAVRDNTVPRCPVCDSVIHRCVDERGMVVWPWHIARTVEWANGLLRDTDWVESAPARHVLHVRDIVSAYELGRARGLSGL